TSIICSPMTSLKTSIKTITYLSDTGCLEIQGASLAGIGYLLYEQIKEYLDTGRLECVLEDWSTERPGFQIYYPNRQYMSCGLRAFLDYVKTGQICQSQRHRPQ
ncbi:hypothetical protein ACR9H2_16870, partial [Escherichia coli]